MIGNEYSSALMPDDLVHQIEIGIRDYLCVLFILSNLPLFLNLTCHCSPSDPPNQMRHKPTAQQRRTQSPPHQLHSHFLSPTPTSINPSAHLSPRRAVSPNHNTSYTHTMGTTPSRHHQPSSRHHHHHKSLKSIFTSPSPHAQPSHSSSHPSHHLPLLDDAFAEWTKILTDFRRLILELRAQKSQTYGSADARANTHVSNPPLSTRELRELFDGVRRTWESSLVRYGEELELVGEEGCKGCRERYGVLPGMVRGFGEVVAGFIEELDGELGRA